MNSNPSQQMTVQYPRIFIFQKSPILVTDCNIIGKSDLNVIVVEQDIYFLKIARPHQRNGDFQAYRIQGQRSHIENRELPSLSGYPHRLSGPMLHLRNLPPHRSGLFLHESEIHL